MIRTDDAEEDLEKYVSYLVEVKNNPQAARNLLNDYDETIGVLEEVAGILSEPSSWELKKRCLKRINFLHHAYLMLYCIENDVVYVTAIFHQLEDFESKLR